MSVSVSVNGILTPEELSACRAYFISTSKSPPEHLAKPACFHFWARLVALTLRQDKAASSDTVPEGLRSSASATSTPSSSTTLPSVTPITSSSSSATIIAVQRPPELPISESRKSSTPVTASSTSTTPTSLSLPKLSVAKEVTKKAAPKLSTSSASLQKLAKITSKNALNNAPVDGPKARKTTSAMAARQDITPFRQTAKRSSTMPSSAITRKPLSCWPRAPTTSSTNIGATKEAPTQPLAEPNCSLFSSASRTVIPPDAYIDRTSSGTIVPSVASWTPPDSPLKPPADKANTSSSKLGIRLSKTELSLKTPPASRPTVTPVVTPGPTMNTKSTIGRNPEEPKITIQKTLYDELMRIYQDHKKCQLKPQDSLSKPIPKEPKTLQKGTDQNLPTNLPKRKYGDMNGRGHYYDYYSV
ncbi:unnamed protein product [Rhizoctonia solani]|uniref:Uncharacterized protein n=1 Tax=Rhizoctonia solani TaxID=456999 RepID=A0A8H3C3Z1_9AGAM|nr:unnamed protein product [Rhizoctonia solani]